MCELIGMGQLVMLTGAGLLIVFVAISAIPAVQATQAKASEGTAQNNGGELAARAGVSARDLIWFFIVVLFAVFANVFTLVGAPDTLPIEKQPEWLRPVRRALGWGGAVVLVLGMLFTYIFPLLAPACMV